jgi:hypothetical protein
VSTYIVVERRFTVVSSCAVRIGRNVLPTARRAWKKIGPRGKIICHRLAVTVPNIIYNTVLLDEASGVLRTVAERIIFASGSCVYIYIYILCCRFVDRKLLLKTSRKSIGTNVQWRRVHSRTAYRVHSMFSRNEYNRWPFRPCYTVNQ